MNTEQIPLNNIFSLLLYRKDYAMHPIQLKPCLYGGRKILEGETTFRLVYSEQRRLFSSLIECYKTINRLIYNGLDPSAFLLGLPKGRPSLKMPLVRICNSECKGKGYRYDKGLAITNFYIIQGHPTTVFSQNVRSFETLF